MSDEKVTEISPVSGAVNRMVERQPIAVVGIYLSDVTETFYNILSLNRGLTRCEAVNLIGGLEAVKARLMDEYWDELWGPEGDEEEVDEEEKAGS